MVFTILLLLVLSELAQSQSTGTITVSSPESCIIIAQIASLQSPNYITSMIPICPSSGSQSISWPLSENGDGAASNIGIYGDVEGGTAGCVMSMSQMTAMFSLGRTLEWQQDGTLLDLDSGEPMKDPQDLQILSCSWSNSMLSANLVLPDPESTLKEDSIWQQPIMLSGDQSPPSSSTQISQTMPPPEPAVSSTSELTIQIPTSTLSAASLLGSAQTTALTLSTSSPPGVTVTATDFPLSIAQPVINTSADPTTNIEPPSSITELPSSTATVPSDDPATSAARTSDSITITLEASTSSDESVSVPEETPTTTESTPDPTQFVPSEKQEASGFISRRIVDTTTIILEPSENVYSTLDNSSQISTTLDPLITSQASSEIEQTSSSTVSDTTTTYMSAAEQRTSTTATLTSSIDSTDRTKPSDTSVYDTTSFSEEPTNSLISSSTLSDGIVAAESSVAQEVDQTNEEQGVSVSQSPVISQTSIIPPTTTITLSDDSTTTSSATLSSTDSTSTSDSGVPSDSITTDNLSASSSSTEISEPTVLSAGNNGEGVPSVTIEPFTLSPEVKAVASVTAESDEVQSSATPSNISSSSVESSSTLPTEWPSSSDTSENSKTEVYVDQTITTIVYSTGSPSDAQSPTSEVAADSRSSTVEAQAQIAGTTGTHQFSSTLMVNDSISSAISRNTSTSKVLVPTQMSFAQHAATILATTYISVTPTSVEASASAKKDSETRGSTSEGSEHPTSMKSSISLPTGDASRSISDETGKTGSSSSIGSSYTSDSTSSSSTMQVSDVTDLLGNSTLSAPAITALPIYAAVESTLSVSAENPLSSTQTGNFTTADGSNHSSANLASSQEESLTSHRRRHRFRGRGRMGGGWGGGGGGGGWGGGGGGWGGGWGGGRWGADEEEGDAGGWGWVGAIAEGFGGQEEDRPELVNSNAKAEPPQPEPSPVYTTPAARPPPPSPPPSPTYPQATPPLVTTRASVSAVQSGYYYQSSSLIQQPPYTSSLYSSSAYYPASSKAISVSYTSGLSVVQSSVHHPVSSSTMSPSYATSLSAAPLPPTTRTGSAISGHISSSSKPATYSFGILSSSSNFRTSSEPMMTIQTETSLSKSHPSNTVLPTITHQSQAVTSTWLSETVPSTPDDSVNPVQSPSSSRSFRPSSTMSEIATTTATSTLRASTTETATLQQSTTKIATLETSTTRISTFQTATTDTATFQTSVTETSLATESSTSTDIETFRTSTTDTETFQTSAFETSTFQTATTATSTFQASTTETARETTSITDFTSQTIFSTEVTSHTTSVTEVTTTTARVEQPVPVTIPSSSTTASSLPASTSSPTSSAQVLSAGTPPTSSTESPSSTLSSSTEQPPPLPPSTTTEQPPPPLPTSTEPPLTTQSPSSSDTPPPPPTTESPTSSWSESWTSSSSEWTEPPPSPSSEPPPPPPETPASSEPPAEPSPPPEDEPSPAGPAPEAPVFSIDGSAIGQFTGPGPMGARSLRAYGQPPPTVASTTMIDAVPSITARSLASPKRSALAGQAMETARPLFSRDSFVNVEEMKKRSFSKKQKHISRSRKRATAVNSNFR